MVTTVPSLDPDGWVTSSLKKADYLFSHFITSDYSQTYAMPGDISSFAYVMQKNQGSVPATIAELEKTLIIYFSKYFKNVIVEITDSTIDVNNSNVSLNIYINFTDDDNITHTLGNLIQFSGTKVNKVTNINNNG